MAEIVSIASADDARIAGYRDVRERDLVGREGLFIAEGEVVVRRLVASPQHEILSLLVAEKRVAGLRDILERLPDAAIVFAARQGLMDKIVGFPIHRGILALGRPKEAPSAEALLAAVSPMGCGGALAVVLIGLANHDNVGGVFRNAAAFGADAVLLDAECCDPLYRKAIRVSVGATLLVPFARLPRGSDPLAPLLAAGFQPVALTPGGGIPLSAASVPRRAALIFGPEGPGLDTDLIKRCQAVRIEMAAGLDSLNVATASGIALHHFAQGTGAV